jgi:hypothetical protein
MEFGIIEMIETKAGNRKRLKIEGQFFSYFGKVQLKEGDGVEFEHKLEPNPRNKDKPYATITEIKVVGLPTPLPGLDRETSIIRQTCIKAAAQSSVMKDQSTDFIIARAEKFEAWVRKERTGEDGKEWDKR